MSTSFDEGSGRLLRRHATFTVVTDESAYEDLVREYWPRLVLIVARSGASKEDAENAAQEAVIAGWRHIKNTGVDTPVRDMPKWLATVALRQYWRHVRSMSRMVLVDDVGEVRTPGPGFEELSAETQQVRAALACLELRERLVMVLYQEGYTAEQSAQFLTELDSPGTTATDVHVLRRRARRKLAERLKTTAEGGEGS